MAVQVEGQIGGMTPPLSRDPLIGGIVRNSTGRGWLEGATIPDLVRSIVGQQISVGCRCPRSIGGDDGGEITRRHLVPYLLSCPADSPEEPVHSRYCQRLLLPDGYEELDDESLIGIS